jgi:hypothetical protein
VLAEGGVLGFALYVWVLGAAGWALVLVVRRNGALGVALAAVLVALFVHSLLYAGFFEDPLAWGVLGIVAAFLAVAPVPREADEAQPATSAPRLLAH